MVDTTLHTPARPLRRAAGLLAAVPLAAGLVLAGGATTGSAQAAEVPTWERLAGCESGNNWGTNTGNGYYGGLQFSDSTWDAYAQPQMANRADLASKKAQIITAERLLEATSWNSWPACSDKLGLGPAEAQGDPYDNQG